MTPLRRRMTEDLQLRNRSPRTIQCYTWHVAQFAAFCGQSPDLLGPEDVRRYQVHLVQVKQVGWSSFNQCVCALKFLYRTTLNVDWHVEQIPFGKRPRKLRSVLGPEDVQRLLACTAAIAPRMVLTTLYASGLRLQEALQLQLTDIDSRRGQIRVMGKGSRERMVPLSPRLLNELRDYWNERRPETWLFPSLRSKDKVFNSTSIQKALPGGCETAGIRTRCTPHTLRHSYATGLLEAGVDLLTIQRLPGHSSFSTTLVYLHVRRPHLEATQGPLDWLPVQQCPRIVSPEAPETDSTGNVPPSPSGRSSSSTGKPLSPGTDTDCRSTS